MDIGILTGIDVKRYRSSSISESGFREAELKSDSLKNQFEEILGIMKEGAKPKNNSFGSEANVDDNTELKNADKCNSGEEVQKEKVKPDRQPEIKLKNIDEELHVILSLLVSMSLSEKINNDDESIQIKGNQVKIAGMDINIVLDQETVKTIADNLNSNLKSSFEKFVSEIASGNLSEYSNKSLKDIFRKIFYDAVMQSIPSETGNPAMSKSELSPVSNPENIQVNTDDLESFKLQEIPKDAKSELSSVSNSENIQENTTDSNLLELQEVSESVINELKHPVDKLISKLEVLGRFEDMDLENLIKIAGSDKAGFNQEKKKLFDLGEKFVSEISNVLKNLTENPGKADFTKYSKESGNNNSNSGVIKPAKNPVFFEEKLMQAADIRTGQEIIINNAAEKTGTPIDNPNTYTRINPSDIISQINSRVIGENGQILKSFEVKLKPESLGMIKIKAEEMGNGISVKIITQYSYTEKIIISGMELLKKNFSESGYRLNDLSVFSDTSIGNQSNAGSQDLSSFLNQGFASDFSSKDSGMFQGVEVNVKTGEKSQSADYKINVTEYGDPYHIDVMA